MLYLNSKASVFFKSFLYWFYFYYSELLFKYHFKIKHLIFFYLTKIKKIPQIWQSLL